MGNDLIVSDPPVSQAIAKLLPRVPERNDALPVFVRVAGVVRFLGHAMTHAEAEMVGMEHRIGCTRISRAALADDTRTFFVLH